METTWRLWRLSLPSCCVFTKQVNATAVTGRLFCAKTESLQPAFTSLWKGHATDGSYDGFLASSSLSLLLIELLILSCVREGGMF